MLTAILILLVVTLGAAALHYYFVHSKTPVIPYQNETVTLRTMQSETERKELHDAQNVINAIRNRRESLQDRFSRRNSFEEASGDFVNLKNVKLSRALSCDSMEDNSDEETNGSGVSGVGSSLMPTEIPDIKEWIKNPTDFFRLRRGSENLGPEERPWQPTDQLLTSQQTVTQPQILISISYLPTAERLSVVIVKAKLPLHFQTSLNYIYVKAHVVDDRTGKRSNKKKTSLKPMEAPVRGCMMTAFNELMIFKFHINLLSLTTIRISCFGYGRTDRLDDMRTGGSMQQQQQAFPSGAQGTASLLLHPDAGVRDNPHTLISRRRSSFSQVRKEFSPVIPLGFIELGSNSNVSSAVTQFTTMMTSMRQPITCWHILQPPKITKRKSFADPSSPRRYSYSREQQQQQIMPAYPLIPPSAHPLTQNNFYPNPDPYPHVLTQDQQQQHQLMNYNTTTVSIEQPPPFPYETSAHMYVNS